MRSITKSLACAALCAAIAGIAPDLPDFRQFFDLVGMQDVRELEERYGVPEDTRLDY